MSSLHWSHRLLSFTNRSHITDRPGLYWQTPSVRKSTSGWPHPIFISSSIIPLSAARSAVTPVYHPHPGPLTHPSVSPIGDGQSRWDSQARSEGWPYCHYSGLAYCHYFQFCLLCCPYPSVTTIKSSAIYSFPQACFIIAFKLVALEP